MYNVTKHKDFEKSFDTKDPRAALPTQVNDFVSQQLVKQIDLFVRKAIRKAIPDETVALFENDGKPFPKLDLHVTLLSPFTRSVEVVFRGHELGNATFEVKIVTKDDVIGKHFNAEAKAKGGVEMPFVVYIEMRDVSL